MAGFLIPVTFRLNFYYHPKCNYAFIASLEKIKQLNLYQEENNRIQTDDAMIFLTDDDLNILELSQNVLTLTGLTMESWKQIEEVNGKSNNMSVIVPNLDDIMMHEFGIQIVPTNDY